MNNFYFLNLNIPLFKEGITVSDLPTKGIAVIDKEKIINEKIFDLFTSLNLKILFVETFYKTSNIPESIHTDVTGGDFTKLNWVIGGGKSQMIWYRPKSNLNKKVFVNSAGSIAIRFAESEVEEIERTPIIYPALVQVGIPHNVINVTENRYCISFVFHNQDNRRPTMQDSVKIFKNYVISRE